MPADHSEQEHSGEKTTAPPTASGGRDPAARSRYRDALRYRDMRLLTAAFLVDQAGSWAYLVVISVYVFDRTHSAQWLAALAVCRWAPGLLLASYGGVIADRYQRTLVLIISSLASAVLMTGLAVVVGLDAPVVLVLILSALSSAVAAPYRPAAGALTPEVVGEQDLAAANAIFAGLENLVVVIGPAIGGLLLLTGQPVIGVIINAASFAVATVVMARLSVRSVGGGADDGNAWQQLATGLRALGAQRVALVITLLCVLDSAVYGASTVLYVPLSIHLGTGPDGYSYLLAGSALGGVLGATLANRLSSASRLAPVLMGSLCLLSLPFLVTVVVHSPALAALLQLISGVGMIIVDILAITSLQRDLPGDVLSRVLGVFETLVLAGTLLASLAAGVVLDHAGLNAALIAIGAGFPVLALMGLPTLLRADRASAAVADRLRPRVDLLARLDLFTGADRSTLELLASGAEEVAWPAGRTVISQGDPADALWILADGELSVSAVSDDGSPSSLAPVASPGYVGEIGLLHGVPRTATVRTSRECTLLRIGSEEFLSALQASRPSPSLLLVAGTRLARTRSQPSRRAPTPAG